MTTDPEDFQLVGDRAILKLFTFPKSSPILNNSIDVHNRISPNIKTWLDIRVVVAEDTSQKTLLHGESLKTFKKVLVDPLIERRKSIKGDHFKPTSDYELIQSCLRNCYTLASLSLEVIKDFRFEQLCKSDVDTLLEIKSQIYPQLKKHYQKQVQT